ncbi:MAG: hypothetical protein WKG07_15995 [Hymenobacter sp.]
MLAADFHLSRAAPLPLPAGLAARYRAVRAQSVALVPAAAARRHRGAALPST